MTDQYTREQVAEALEESIEHWKFEAAKSDPKHINIYVDACPLCDLFIVGNEERDACSGCPVSNKTGSSMCRNSPWDRAHLDLHLWKSDEGDQKAFRSSAQKEIAFLESLREPKGESDADA